MEQAIPALAVFEFQWSFAIGTPFAEESGAAIFPLEQRLECFLKTAAERHSRPCFLFAPAVQIMMPIAARAAQIVRNLAIAKGHRRIPALPYGLFVRGEELPIRQPVQKLRGFGRNGRSA